MITKINYIESTSFNPYENLALEEYLLRCCDSGQCILYLWQNKNTIVIGRNQNPWKECRLEKLKNDGGTLVRRLSGGGAVYHDIGNLNFTFLVNKDEYSLDKQLEVILRAVKKLGINAEKSGRNDILAEGRKFSGNAFYKQEKYCYHHGTIMLDVDIAKLSQYLNVSQDKLKSKGVSSVKSRVINLTEFDADLSIEALKSTMKEAFEEVYGLRAESLTAGDIDAAQLEKYKEKFSSWEWIYGKNPDFKNEFSYRFDWGSTDICLNVQKGIIADAILYSDSLEPHLMLSLPEVFKGIKYDKASVTDALEKYTAADQTQQQMLGDIISGIDSEDF